MASDAKFAIRLAVDGGQSVEDTLRRIAAAATDAAGKVQTSNAATGQSFAAMGPQLQAAGYQVGDFFTQIAAGTNPITAFAQQIGQLAGSFGGWKGAVAGAGLTLAAIGLQFALAKSDAEKLTEAVERAAAVFKESTADAERYRTGLEAEAESVRKLATYYGTLSDARRAGERARIDGAQQDLTRRQATLFARIPSDLRGLAAQETGYDEALSRITGGLLGLSPAMREAAAAMREFDAAGSISREGLEKFIGRLNTLADGASGRDREALRAWRDALIALVPGFEDAERAGRTLGAQAEALKGNADGAARAITGLGATARQEATALDELARGVRNAGSELVAFRERGLAGLRDVRRDLAIDDEARRLRETTIRESMSRDGLSRTDAERAADAGEAERRRLIRDRVETQERLRAETTLGDSRQALEDARRLGRVPQARRPVEQARITAEREADERGLSATERAELIRNRAAAAEATLTSSGGKARDTAEALAAASLRAAEAAEQGRAAFLRQSAAIEAAREAAQNAGTAEGALAESILRRNAAQAAQRGAGAVLELKERVEAARALAEAETPLAQQEAQRAEQTRQATAELRGYAEAVRDPAIRAALEAEIKIIERLRGEWGGLTDQARNRQALFSQQQQLDRIGADRAALGMSPRERARFLGEFGERQRLEAQGLNPDDPLAADRIRRAGEIGLAQEDFERLREFRSLAAEAGSALSEAFKSAALEGKDLGQTLKDLDKRLADIAFRALVEKPFERLLGNLAGDVLGGKGGTGGAGGVLGSLFSSIFGGGGADGGIKAAVAHGGGIAGEGLASRAAGLGLFLGAPRYHGGGVAGLGPDEVPAILRRGERIRTLEQEAALQRQMAARGGGVRVTLNVNGVADADSFRRSEGQILAGLARGMQRARRHA